MNPLPASTPFVPDTIHSLNPRVTCRVCGSGDLTELFSLGEQYVSDFPESPDPSGRPRVPITLDLCGGTTGGCGLVQQRYTAPQDFLYTRHYWYRSGVTATMRQALADVVQQARVRVGGLNSGDVVLDIGANDGSLLSWYNQAVIRVGVEPAVNLAQECRSRCEVFIPEFWSAERYTRAFSNLYDQANHPRPVLETDRWRPKVVTACGMFYDLEDPNQFIADVAKVLHPEGVFVAQLMCLRQTIENNDVGNLCHEHLEFYSFRSLEHLLGAHGLEVFDVESNSVNGGSYRLYCRHRGSRVGGTSVWPGIVRDEERLSRLDRPETYRKWFARLGENRDRCIDFVAQKAMTGRKVWAYGASTKGNVILQWYGLDHRLIEAVADRSPEKAGRYTVGTGIPVRSEEEFRAAAPDYALVLPYAFKREFLAREAAWQQGGGKFVFPLPSFEVV